MPITRPSLLVRIRDVQDVVAWEQFVEIYAPLVYGYARRRGLQDADAADLTQESLQSVARAAKRLDYDPNRGSFRNWLLAVVRNKVNTFLARRKPGHQGSGGSDAYNLLCEQPDADQDIQWDREYDRQLFAWAAAQVRDSFETSTWRSFWLTAVEGESGKEVATELGLSVAAVYLAKGRVMARLKEKVQSVHED